MTNPAQPSTELSPLKRAFLVIERLEAKLKAADESSREPIAIIGVGCRFPGGADNPDAFWQLLHDGVDAITDVPSGRWNVDSYYSPVEGVPGKMSTRQGGFLNGIDLFDSQFFEIAPREAASMDPQQRLLLEVAWEALENAGQAPDELSGSRTGVFIGIVNNDYRQLKLDAGGLQNIDSYYSSGIAQSMASGRLSYVLGLQGPSISLDTACSSSLVTVHLACQSLRSRESNMALAGGVNLILTPEISVALSKYQMLARDGRCKTFDASADGYGRGEGCGLIVLKRLSDAIANGDNILALILGSAVNQDGPSSGLTAPNGPAQEIVIRDALANAGLKPTEITYVEAHGTGTSLGDPIELQALASVFGERKADRPLIVGSVKTNVGHLEGAAGIAALIKTALALQKRVIPAHLHFHDPNPFVHWSELPITIPTQTTPWPAEAPLAAGVSSFGFSGTNAHIILGAAAQPQITDAGANQLAYILKLSTKSESALKELAQRFHQYLTTAPENALADICYSANVGRADLSHRLVITAESRNQILQRLSDFVSSQNFHPGQNGIKTGWVQRGDPPKVGFLFTGQGSQYPGMGRQLFETQPTFRRIVEKCAEILQPYLRGSLLDVLFAEGEGSPLIHETEYTQPALFVLEYALAELWRSWGIQPSVVMGHSVGEYVAACIAGVFSLEDGLKLIAARGRLMQDLPPVGQMATIFAAPQDVSEVLKPYEDRIAVAAINGPQNFVLSGERSSVQTIVETLSGQGIKSRQLTVSHSFHSPLMEPMLSDFEKIASEVKYSSPKIKIISNVTGQLAMGNTLAQAGYWRDQIRKPVQFEASMQVMRSQGIQLFLEVGPNPVLLGLGQRCLAQDKESLAWLPSLHKGHGDTQTMLQSLGEMYAQGVEVDWDGLEKARESKRRRVSLPTSPFERRKHWVKESLHPKTTHVDSSAIVHPLLGTRLRSAMKEIQFEVELGAHSFSFLQDHRVQGQSIMPGLAYVEIALAIAKSVFEQEQCRLTDLIIQEPLLLPEETERTIQVIVAPDNKESARFQVFSLPNESVSNLEKPWRLHATGTVAIETARGAALQFDTPELIRERCSEEITSAIHYQTLRSVGLEFGPSLQGVQQIWRRSTGGEAIGRIKLPESLVTESKAFHIHPALLDACVQVLSAAIPQEKVDTYLPWSIGAFHLYDDPGTELWSHVSLQNTDRGSSDTLKGTIRLINNSGDLVGAFDDILMRRAVQEPAQKITSDTWLYTLDWQPAAEPEPSLPERQFALADLSEPLQAETNSLIQQVGLTKHHEAIQQLEALSVNYIIRALRQLGWNPLPQERVNSAELAARLGILSKYYRLLDRFLSILAEEGWLKEIEKSGDQRQWCLRRSLERTDSGPNIDRLLHLHPHTRPQIALTQRCAENLATVLNGTIDPLQLLFPDGSTADAEALYQDAPEAKVFNTLTGRILETIATQTPNHPLRILEIGAGTGGTTSSVLPVLKDACAEYRFTDISQVFLSRAREKFKNYPFMQYQLLNIELGPAAQGLKDRQFDIVLAVNVLHATADLSQTFAHVRQLLAPGGILVVSEITAPERWIDITFGLTDGWWRYADLDRRESYPLLAREKWIELLSQFKFSEITVVPEMMDLATNAIFVGRAPQQSTAGSWLIFADASGVGTQLAARLQTQGEQSILVYPGDTLESLTTSYWQINPANPEDFHQLWREAVLKPQTTLKGIVHLWSLDIAQPQEAAETSLMSDQLLGTGSVLNLAKTMALDSLPGQLWANLWLVTQNAQPLAQTETLHLGQSPVWGLAKVIDLEYPDWHCLRLDLDGNETVDAQAKSLLKEILRKIPVEAQIAHRGQTRYVARLNPYKPRANFQEIDSSVQLQAPNSGVLDDITLQKSTRRAPAQGEVEIRVMASGLIFRDVMNALAMRSDPEPLGSECSGRIVAVGDGVTNFNVGDDVVAVTNGAFSRYVTVDAGFVAYKPAHVDFNEAATVPTAFMTAHYALSSIAQLKAGQRVLIHAAAGGVGSAAVQLALQVGAEVFGTAGSAKKKVYLESIGVRHVLNSRTLDFADEIMRLTSGEGVDVILNSLSGEFIPLSLSVLADHGVFLEIGKRDIWTPEQVAALKPDVRYHVIDLSRHGSDQPQQVQSLFQTIMTALHEHRIEPLRFQTFPLENAVNAFRYMAQAKHIGKVILTQRDVEKLPIREDASYLITGGLTGLGLLTAQHLVAQGARHLALMGRRQATESAQQAIATMTEAGARILIFNGDISRFDDVQQVVQKIEAEMPPLRGIIHSAGILDDGVLQQQKWEKFINVMSPKLDGAWYLHSLTREKQLDFFVLFSSIASIFGNAGQANHAAANSFLDVLAHYRHQHGLPALSINWGIWSGVGIAAEMKVGERAEQKGITTISPEKGLQVFDELLQDTTAQVVVAPIQWEAFVNRYAAAHQRAWLSSVSSDQSLLLSNRRVSPSEESSPALQLQLKEVPPNQKRDVVVAFLSEQVRRVLGLEPSQTVDPRQPLEELGLDSLTAVELRNMLSSSLKLDRNLPATLVFDYPTVNALTDYLAQDLLQEELRNTPTVKAPTPDADLVKNIENLSDEEVDRMLSDMK